MTNWADIEYKSAVTSVLDSGEPRADRTGVGTHAIFGTRLVFDLQDGFPILTTKKIHFKSVVTELLWFLKGDTNTAYLKEHGCSIWNEWEDENGDLGPVYGHQWRSFPKPDGGYVDQIYEVVQGLINNPTSRRHLVVAWNPGQLEKMALPPCHVLFQFYLNNKRELSCQIYQRSVDVGLGLPFNIASYALLTHLIAQEIEAKVGRLIHIGGDVHIYDNHRSALTEQIERGSYPAPRLILPKGLMATFSPNDIKLENYQSHGKIKMDVAV